MGNNITTLLYKIKENIEIIENHESDEVVLDEVCSDFLNMIELMKLFLISERDSYYGYFLMNIKFSVDFNSDSIAGIKLNSFPPVFVANPLLLCKFKMKEILYVICHEIDHIVLNHPTEMIRSNPTRDQEIFYKFNLAADAAVNDRIDYEIDNENHSFLSRPEGVITSDVLSKMFHLGKIIKMENYAYYFELIKDKTDNQSNFKNGAQSMMDEQNKKDNNNTSEMSDISYSVTVEADNEDDKKQKIVTSKNCQGNIGDHQWEVEEDEEDAAAIVREFVNSAVEMMNEETRGMMPASFISQVEKLNKPPVLSWQAILKKYVGTITANKQRTRMRLNRRQPERFDLSGSRDEKVLKLVVAIDTSASVDDQMIAYIFNEIFAILAKRKHDITVIECDSEVKRVYKAHTPADVKLEVMGRGGTWFSPAIEYINSDKYYRDALLIYFTDGYGEAEIPRPRTYRNIWVIVGRKENLSVKEPYGIVLNI